MGHGGRVVHGVEVVEARYLRNAPFFSEQY